ncbi:winged helix DNA-binding domain-containing protein [Actinomadura sp. ATCC 31491]|uniref:Winged helix DNA-binding domain-containing protein n=1 Tax=Actinomadura luzonensis TaxID=2805427 RepID=A0ABT0FVZ0_9ACTN|nr:winged helix DNA-binding domain-containing protein [Actinomadura luzonensis]MCK2216150.1 winged helix DNA-binding domain-containing protein [Actinomadura luzonensis]
MIELSWPQVSARRLERAGLGAGPALPGPVDAVAAMCGAHAQVMPAAEASVGLRLAGATRAHVRDALRPGGQLVKTYGPRGTVHLLPARDLPMWVSALSSMPGERNPHAPHIRMTPEQTERVVAAIGAAVGDGELTIDELSERVVAAAGPWAGDLVVPAFGGQWPRWRQAMSLAAHRGAFVFGPDRGRKVTYTRPPAGTGAVADGAAELARRYLTGYGPATPAQFARWAGGPVRWAARAFEAAGVEEVRFEGRPAWVVAGDTAMPGEPPRGVRLLPYFDAYVVAGQPRELLYPGAAAGRALNRGQAGNFPVLLVDGVVAGVWHQRRSGDRLDVTVEPLRDLGPARERELEEQVERLGKVLEARPRLTVGVVTVGAHA